MISVLESKSSGSIGLTQCVTLKSRSHLVPKITHVQPYGIANSLIIAKESEIAFKGVDSLSYKLNTPPYD